MSQVMESIPENHVLLKNSVVSMSSVVLSIGIMVSYGYAALLLDPTIFLDLLFWNPIAIIASIMNVSIISLIIYNTRVNFKFRNLFLKVPIDHVEVLYLMCLPALIVVIITSFLTTIEYIVEVKCYDYGSAILSLSLSAYFVAVLILLIETNGLIEYGENWTLNFSNYSTILLTITSLIGYTVLNVATEQVNIFINNINIKFVECRYNDSFSVKVHTLSTYFQSYKWKSTILFGISCSIFLINPLVRHRHHLEKYTLLNNNNVENSTIRTGISVKLTVLIALFSTFLLASTIAVTISAKVNIQYVYQLTTMALYILLIVAMTMLLSCAKLWQDLSGKQRTFNDVLIWMTFCGITFHSLAMIVASVNQLSHSFSPLYVITLIKYILLSIQITMQNMLEKTLLNKNWKKQPIKNFTYVLPLFLFVGLCNGILTLTNFIHAGKPLFTPSTNKFFILFFVQGFDNLGEILGSLQRFHGTVLFMYLFISILRESRNV